MEKKEAMKILKDFYDKSALFSIRTALDTVIPELKESEDDRIRKALIAIITDFESLYLQENYSLSREEALAWLEKQGEDNKEEYSVWVGGVEINNYYLSKEEAEKLAEEYKKDGYDDVIVEKQGEQKPANWLQELEDKLANATPQQLAEWKEKYFKEEPAEWSEEDEEIISVLIRNLEACADGNAICFNPSDSKKYATWLKSLRPQSQWKPSDEQIKAVKEGAKWQKEQMMKKQ